MQSSPEHIRELTQEILKRGEFYSEVEKAERWKQIFIDFFDTLQKWSTENPDGANILIFVCIILLLGIFGHIIYVFVKEFNHSPPASGKIRSLNNSVVSILGENAVSFDAAWANAWAALEKNDYYQSIWIGHRLFLSILDAKGLIQFRRWKTNQHYQKECQSPQQNQQLSDLNMLYDHIVYAHGAVEATSIADALNRIKAQQAIE
jgi:hypothetical protein